MGLRTRHKDADDRESDEGGHGDRDTPASVSLAEAQERVVALESSLASQARAHSDSIHILCHELRTPITVIAGFGRLLMDPSHGSLTDRQDGFVNEVLKACQRLNGLVGDLLEASPEAGTALPVERKCGDLNATIYAMLTSLSPLWADKEIQVDVDLDPEVPEIDFDSARIEQVLTNLLTNAIRYGRRDGVVRIGSLRCDDSNDPSASVVQVFVEDDGPGIPVADRVRVFEPYVRGDHRSECGGMGIGLAICHRIIASHAGAIRVEEGSRGGARFVFTLPFAPNESQE